MCLNSLRSGFRARSVSFRSTYLNLFIMTLISVFLLILSCKLCHFNMVMIKSECTYFTR